MSIIRNPSSKGYISVNAKDYVGVRSGNFILPVYAQPSIQRLTNLSSPKSVRWGNIEEWIEEWTAAHEEKELKVNEWIVAFLPEFKQPLCTVHPSSEGIKSNTWFDKFKGFAIEHDDDSHIEAFERLQEYYNNIGKKQQSKQDYDIDQLNSLASRLNDKKEKDWSTDIWTPRD